MLRCVSVICLLVTGWLWGDAALIFTKAQLAPVLIRSAWADSLQNGGAMKPWPWADTWPVARLQVPELNVDQFVLYGANGASLPFGPGHLTGSSAPGYGGTVIIAGHRDTHFAFMPDLEPGHEIRLQGRNGLINVYRVKNQEVIDARQSLLESHNDVDQLILVTCEPADMLDYRGPWRLVTVARRD